MRSMRVLARRPWLPAGVACVTMLLAGPGCQSLDPTPTKAAATMAGDWRVDAAASDDFDRKLTPLLQQVRRHEQPRLSQQGAQPGAPPTGAGGVQVQPLFMPPEDLEKIRTRLGDDLRPAA